MTDFDLTKDEAQLFRRLNTPHKIQDFLEAVPINFERSGETVYSPRQVLKNKKAHCMEGALFAAAVFQFHGQKPYLLHLKTTKNDFEHIVAPFQIQNHWGAISKTNHAVLRYREPVYKNIRELVMSYFHEYFLNTTAQKTLREFSDLFDLTQFNSKSWVTSDEDLWYIDRALDKIPHHPILTKSMIKTLRPADLVEVKAGKITSWPKVLTKKPKRIN